MWEWLYTNKGKVHVHDVLLHPYYLSINGISLKNITYTLL